MRVLKTSVLVLMTLFLVVGITYAQTVEEYYNKGIEYGVQGKFQEAEKEFKNALEIGQFYSPAKYCLKLIEDVLEKKVENEVAIYLFNAVDCGNKGMFDEEIAEYKKALAINPNYAEAHNNLGVDYHNKRQAACMSNLKQLGLAMKMYTQDCERRLPEASNWCDALLEYVGGNKKIFQCPEVPEEECAYAFNDNLDGISLREVKQPGETVVLFEADGGWNAYGTQARMASKTRHHLGNNFLFADGHVEPVVEHNLLYVAAPADPKALADLRTATDEMFKLAKQLINPTPLGPVKGLTEESFFSAEGEQQGPYLPMIRFKRDVTNEITFIETRVQTAHKAASAASIAFPNHADEFDSLLRTLESSIQQAFPEYIDAKTDLRACGKKVNAAVMDYTKKLRAFLLGK